MEPVSGRVRAFCTGQVPGGWRFRQCGRKCVAVDRKIFEGGLARRILKLSALLLGIQIMTNSCGAVLGETVGEKGGLGTAMLRSLAAEAEDVLYGQFLPALEAGSGGKHWLWQEQINTLLPFYGCLFQGAEEKQGEASVDFRTIMLAEAEEGTYQAEEDGISGKISGAEAGGSIGERLPGTEGIAGKNPVDSAAEPAEDSAGETLEELLRAENEAALQMQSSTFMPHGRMKLVNLEPLSDYQTLVSQFYTIDANTMAGSDQLNVEKLLGADMTVSRDSPGPQILIYHTHSQEAFADSRPGDESGTIMGVGDRLTEILTYEYGYEVLHHRGKYDVDSRDDAYSNALADIEQVLKENPSIQVVIDLHRDEMPESTRLVMDLDGKPTARFMFFNGLSRTRKTGNIAYLYNENLDSNLAFSFQMQLKAMEYYPGLTRRIYLKGYRYNMHLRPKSLLIELGAQNNTVEEAMNACDPLAHILDLVLSGE